MQDLYTSYSLFSNDIPYFHPSPQKLNGRGAEVTFDLQMMKLSTNNFHFRRETGCTAAQFAQELRQTKKYGIYYVRKTIEINSNTYKYIAGLFPFS